MSEVKVEKIVFEDKFEDVSECNFFGIYKGEDQKVMDFYLCYCNYNKVRIICQHCISSCHDCPNRRKLKFDKNVPSYQCDCKEILHKKIKSDEIPKTHPHCIYNEILKISPQNCLIKFKESGKTLCKFCYYSKCMKFNDVEVTEITEYNKENGKDHECNCEIGHDVINEDFNLDFFKVALNFNFNSFSKYDIYSSFYISPFNQFDGVAITTKLSYALNMFNLIEEKRKLSFKYYNPNLLTENFNFKKFMEIGFNDNDYISLLGPKITILYILFLNNIRTNVKSYLFDFKLSTLLNMSTQQRHFYLSEYKKLKIYPGILEKLEILNGELKRILKYIRNYIRLNVKAPFDNIELFHKFFKFLIKYQIVPDEIVELYYDIIFSMVEFEFAYMTSNLDTSLTYIYKSITYSVIHIYDKLTFEGEIVNHEFQFKNMQNLINLNKTLTTQLRIYFGINSYCHYNDSCVKNLTLLLTNSNLNLNKSYLETRCLKDFKLSHEINQSPIENLNNLRKNNELYYEKSNEKYLDDSVSYIEAIIRYFSDKNKNTESQLFCTTYNFYENLKQFTYHCSNLKRYLKGILSISNDFQHDVLKFLATSFNSNFNNFVLFTNQKFKIFIKVFLNTDEESIMFIKTFLDNIVLFKDNINDFIFYKKFLKGLIDMILVAKDENLINLNSKIFSLICKSFLNLNQNLDSQQKVNFISVKFLLDRMVLLKESNLIYKIEDHETILKFLNELENNDCILEYIKNIVMTINFALSNGYTFFEKINKEKFDLYIPLSNIYFEYLIGNQDKNLELVLVQYFSNYNSYRETFKQYVDFSSDETNPLRKKYQLLKLNSVLFYNDYVQNEEPLTQITFYENDDDLYLKIIERIISNAKILFIKEKYTFEEITYGVAQPFLILFERMLNNVTWNSWVFSKINEMFLDVLEIIKQYINENFIRDGEADVEFYQNAIKDIHNQVKDYNDVVDYANYGKLLLLTFVSKLQRQSEQKKISGKHLEKTIEKLKMKVIIDNFIITMNKLQSIWTCNSFFFIHFKKMFIDSASLKILDYSNLDSFYLISNLIIYSHGSFQCALKDSFEDDTHELLENFPFIIIYYFYTNFYFVLRNFDKFNYTYGNSDFPYKSLIQSIELINTFCYQNRYISRLIIDLEIDHDQIDQAYSRHDFKSNKNNSRNHSEKYNIFDICFNVLELIQRSIMKNNVISNKPLVIVYKKICNLILTLIREATVIQMDYFSKENYKEPIGRYCIETIYGLSVLLDNKETRFNIDVLNMTNSFFKILNEIFGKSLNEKEIILDMFDIFPPKFIMILIIDYFRQLIHDYGSSKRDSKSEITIRDTNHLFERFVKGDLKQEKILKVCGQLYIYLNLLADETRNQEAADMLNKKFFEAQYDEELDQSNRTKNEYLINIVKVTDQDRVMLINREINYTIEEKNIILDHFFRKIIKCCEFVLPESIIDKTVKKTEKEEKQEEIEPEGEEEEEKEQAELLPEHNPEYLEILNLNKNDESINSEIELETRNYYDYEYRLQKVEHLKFKNIRKLKRTYFALNPKVYLLNPLEIKNVVLGLDSEQDTNLGNEFIDVLPNFIEKITLYDEKFQSSEHIKTLFFLNYELVNKINIFITMFLIILLLLFLDRSNLTNNSINDIIKYTNYFEIVFNSFFVAAFLITKYQINVKLDIKFGTVEESEKGYYQLFNIYFLKNLILDDDVSFIIMNILISMIVVIYPYLYGLLCIQLFTIIKFIRTIRDIFEAFQMKAGQLANMVFFLLIVIICYGNYAYYFINQDYIFINDSGVPQNVCENVILCVLFHFSDGERAGGGIGEVLSIAAYGNHQNYFLRYFGDLLFFMFVILLVLNMINGLIITTFSQLRERQEKNEQFYEGMCLICKIPKDAFDERNLDFREHFEQHHYINYMYFLLTMKFTDYYKRNDNQHKINRKVDMEKTDFLPYHRTFFISNGEDFEKKVENDEIEDDDEEKIIFKS